VWPIFGSSVVGPTRPAAEAAGPTEIRSAVRPAAAPAGQSVGPAGQEPAAESGPAEYERPAEQVAAASAAEMEKGPGNRALFHDHVTIVFPFPKDQCPGMKSAAPSRLQADLAHRILARLRQENAAPGHHLVELELCAAFGVSRTPV